jgi:hypothetical protein
MSAEENKSVDQENIDEGTTAAETLKPHGGSGGGESKSEMLSTFVSLMSQLGKEDLSKFLNQSLAQIGKEAEHIPGGAAAKNKATIAAKSVKEDLDELFGADDEETLSEEFKDKASTIFEAAINTKINLELIRLEEEFADMEVELREQLEDELQEKANEIFTSITEKLDNYLDYCVDTYMEENKVALTQDVRTDIAENFLHGLQNLFSEHYIKVPEDRVNVLGEMKAEIDALNDKLNAAINENIELKSAVENADKDAIFTTVSEGLVDTQREKLRTLSEGLEYSDSESYKKKLEIVKESYFTKKATTATETGLITEAIDGEVEEIAEEAAPLTGPMAQYVKQISKSKN